MVPKLSIREESHFGTDCDGKNISGRIKNTYRSNTFLLLFFFCVSVSLSE